MKHDAQGRVLRRTFLNRNGYPTSDANGVFAQEFAHEPSGRTLAVRYLDAGGQPCPTRQGVAGLECQYDPRGNRKQITWLDSACRATSRANWSSAATAERSSCRSSRDCWE